MPSISWASNQSSVPRSPRELYLHSARTDAPARFRATARWPPMNPPAPVTSVWRPSQESTRGDDISYGGAAMPDWAVPLSDVRFEEADVEAVAAAYRSGWLSQGPAVARFESEFADRVGTSHAFADIRGGQQPWLSADAAAAAVTGSTRAIVNVGYAGHPGEADRLRRLAED